MYIKDGALLHNLKTKKQFIYTFKPSGKLIATPNFFLKLETSNLHQRPDFDQEL